MGMCLELVAVSDATIDRLHADPPLVWALLEPDDPDAVTRARAAANRPGCLGRLFGRAAAPVASAGATTLPLAPGEGRLEDLDKAWHGIHFLLTGTAWEGAPPLDLLVAGGREIEGLELGYGPPRTASAAETRAFADALAALDDDALRGRFAPARMMELEIYPEIWDRDPAEDDTLGYLMGHVARLRAAVAAEVSHGHGLLVVLA